MSQQELTHSQHAVLISAFGEPNVMNYQAGVAIPELDAGQVLVKVAYAGINPVDYKTRQGKGWGAANIQKDKFDHDQPAILGFDVAGEVVASHSEKFAIGDKVAALSFASGCYAEYVAVDANLLAIVPDNVTLKQAGALPCAGQTALQFLAFSDIEDGEHVVMNAPAGGVGHLLIQMLMDKITENNIKLTVICSAEKYAKLDSLIDKSQLTGWIDYTKDDNFPDLQADILLDLVGDEAGVRALNVLKSGGRVKVLPSIWVDKLKEAGSDKNLSIDGYAVQPNGEDMARVLQQVADGKLTLVVAHSYPLSEVITAHNELQKGDTFGKIVLQTSEV
ncbi:NADP-dependent oxidoreductase [Psychrobacter sp. 16-MNA-CIBAN-0192]|uniref:NADP-dependent oxidoreductase n=1 Tax=Psychrobacter sp. 16-MNA-CIBAN-0192 TaxID=3140448 RepID=UPI00332D8687